MPKNESVSGLAPSVEISPPLQERTRASFDRIKVAAVELLVEQGPVNFTMAAIAERAGVSVTAIYRRFKGREDLLASTKHTVLFELRQRLDLAVSNAGDSVDDVLRAYAITLSNELRDRVQLYSVLRDGTDNGELRALGTEMLAHTRLLFVSATVARLDGDDRDEISKVATFIWRVLTFSLLNAAEAGNPEAIKDWDDETERLITMSHAYIWAALQLATAPNLSF